MLCVDTFISTTIYFCFHSGFCLKAAIHMRYSANIRQITSSVQRSIRSKLSMFGLVFTIPKKVGIFRKSKWTNVWQTTTEKNVWHILHIYIIELANRRIAVQISTFIWCLPNTACVYLPVHVHKTAWTTFNRCTECRHCSIDLSIMSPILLYFNIRNTNRRLIPSSFSRITILLWDHPHLSNAIIIILFSCFPNFIFTCMANY